MDLIASNSPVNAGKDQNALVSLDFFLAVAYGLVMQVHQPV